MATPENFGLTDQQYFAAPPAPPVPIPPDGLRLGAPSSVSLRARSELPVLIRRASTLQAAALADFAKLGLVHAVDLDRNLLFTGFAVDHEGAVFEEADPATVAGLKGRTEEQFQAELRARVNLPWRPARLLVTATLREKASNSRLVDLGSGPAGYQDPAVAEFLEASRGQKPPEPVPDPPAGSPVPAYQPIDGSPPAPGKPGFAVKGERVTVFGKGAHCLMRCAFRVPVPKQDLVAEPGDDGVRAMVSVHLVLTGADEGTPAQRRLRVPLYAPPDDKGQGVGHFAVDLLTVFGINPKRNQTYFLYLFCREVMSEAQPFAFVTREMVAEGGR
jgi:hypothetical protein